MAGKIESHLASLGITIPEPAEPGGNYVGFVLAGDLVFTAGQVPIENGVRQYIGKLGRDFGIEEGQRAARLAALNVLARVKAACDGDLDRVVRCVKLLGFVNATDNFADQPKVINGASDLIVQVFGEAGRHARSAVGVASLPSGVAVEVEGVFQIRR
jgi:enamine deaminase RidA (YjgF/YER057c/UK114 family)